MVNSLLNRYGPCRAAGESPAGTPRATAPDAQTDHAQPAQPDASPVKPVNGAPGSAQTAGAGAQQPSMALDTANTAGLTDAPQPETPAQTEPAQGDALTKSLLKAVQERVARAEKSVVRSMAEQNGMEEAQLSELLAQAKNTDGGELPPKAQKQMEQLKTYWRERLLTAEVKAVGVELGLLDADVALKLLDPAAVTVGEDGAVSGVREALVALRQSKGYLFGHGGRGAWAQKLGSGSIPPLSGVEEAFYRKNPVLRK